MPVVARRPAFWIIAATYLLFLSAAAAPSPLYALYASRWRFSAITLTEIFAVYAIALLITLLFTGSLSDTLGRRPVIFAALAIQIAGMFAFVTASNVGWLFAARIVQGIATGLATSALAASFVDLQPPAPSTLGAIVNSATPAAGLAFGALGSAILVQYAPDPRCRPSSRVGASEGSTCRLVRASSSSWRVRPTESWAGSRSPFWPAWARSRSWPRARGRRHER